jgi:tripartite ATP-independent transporter DctM subunit
MERLTAGLIFIVVMMVFMLGLRVPAGFAMGLAGALGIYVMRGAGPLANLLSQIPYSTSSGFILLSVPMFILMGFFVAESGLSTDIFIAARRFIGWIRGGLAMTVSVGSALLGAVMGLAGTVSITMATISLPEMRKYGYKDILSVGCTAASGVLGALIPPSIPLIIYGVMTETSIGHLFIAGIIPGILTTFLFCLTSYIWCRVDPTAGAAMPRVPWRQAVRLPSGIYIVILLAIVCLGGIYAGFATPTEAGALGSFVALVFGVASRRMGLKNISRAFTETARTTGMVFILIIGATIFSSMLAMSGIPFKLVEVLQAAQLSHWTVLVMILVIYIILGFFLDIYSILLILMPVLAPVFKAFGFDPVWIGVLTIMTALMGEITPPFGINVFTLTAFVRDVPMWTIFKGAFPYFIAMVVSLLLVIIFPDIALGLVKMMNPWAYG